MAASADELAAIRAWVGSTPDDTAVNAKWDRLLSVEAVALEILRGRRADYEASPASLSVSGEFSMGVGDNIKSLTADIAALELAVASGSPVGVASARLRRVGPSR